MKKNIQFSKAFLGCAVFSVVLIAAGIVNICIRGINLGLDFKPGLIEEVRIAEPAVSVTYTGAATVAIDASNTGIDVVISGIGAENETKTFTYGQNPTVESMVAALNGVDGISAKVLSSASADTYSIFTNNAVTARLSSDSSFYLYVSDGAKEVSVDELRDLLSQNNVNIKELGTETSRSYQIRAKISDDSASNQKLQDGILSALQSKFGKNNVVIVKTDFVGSSFSSSLAYKSILLTIVTIFLIWGYATIRFHWDFALGSVVALLHDCLIMFVFISFLQIEFSTTTLAAILTIFGYSINATVVILDRLRENMKIVNTHSFNDIIDKSLNDTVSRSILTTVTTLFASISLFIFTTGSIHDFAEALTVGLISGCYSSMFIAMGFISFMRKHWEPGENANRVRPRKKTAHAAN